MNREKIKDDVRDFFEIQFAPEEYDEMIIDAFTDFVIEQRLKAVEEYQDKDEIL